MADRASIISAVAYPPDSLREFISVIMPTPGVIGANDMAVVQHAGTPTMSVDVGAGYVVMKGVLSAVTEGSYPFLKDALETKTIAASNPTNPRRDLVCAVVTDSAYAVDGTPNVPNIRVLTGTPAGSPVDPAIPGTWAAYQLLARVRVSANATSITSGFIDDLRTFAQPIRRAAILTTSGPPTSGTYAFGDEATDKFGGGWVCIAAGTPGTWSWTGGGRYRARLYNTSATMAIGTTIDSVVTGFDTLDAATGDPTSMATVAGQGGAASGHMTAVVAGVYQVNAAVHVPTSTGGRGAINLFKNPTFSGNTLTSGLIRRGSEIPNATGGFATNPLCIVSAQVSLAANDTVYVGAFQNSPGTLNLLNGTADLYLEMALISS